MTENKCRCNFNDDMEYLLDDECTKVGEEFDEWIKRGKQKTEKPKDFHYSMELKEEPGKKFDNGKLRLDLLSIPAMMGTAEILTLGAGKYGDKNWEKGMSYSRVFGALLRHLFKWWMGVDIDPDSGKRHIDHAACNLMFLQHYTKLKTGVDDR